MPAAQSVQAVGWKLVRRAVVAGAGALVIAGGVGGAGLLGQVHADDPQCVAGSADPCVPVLDGSVNPLDQPGLQATNPPRQQVVCQPAGKSGAFCYRR